MPSAGTYLQRSRHGTIFYFRRRVPDDLRGLVAKRQLCRTLNTADLRAAIIEARALAAQSDRLFALLRSMPNPARLTPEELEHLRQTLGEWDAPTPKASPSLPLPARGPALPSQKHQPANRSSRPEPESVASFDYTFTLGRDPATGLLVPLLKTEPTDTPEMLAQAHALFREAMDKAFAAGERTVTAAQPAPQQGRRLRQAADQWLAEHVAKQATSTRKEYQRTVEKRMLPFFGADNPVTDLTQKRFADFARDLHERSGERLAVNTRNQILAVVAAFSSWLKAQGELPEALTTKTLAASAERHASRERLPFTLSQVGVIFQNAARYRQREPEKFWITVATAILGCRVEELAQIDLSEDLIHDPASGVHALSINGRPDADGVVRKTLKNLGSERIVPVHSALVRHGFIDFLHRQRERGCARPFESLWKPFIGDSSPPSEDDEDDKASDGRQFIKWSHAASKWGGRELEKLARQGLDRTDRAYFHSLRHTMAQQLGMPEHNIPENVPAAYQGHKIEGASMNRSRYGTLNDEYLALARVLEPALSGYAALLDALPPVPAAKTTIARRRGRPRKDAAQQ